MEIQPLIFPTNSENQTRSFPKIAAIPCGAVPDEVVPLFKLLL